MEELTSLRVRNPQVKRKDFKNLIQKISELERRIEELEKNNVKKEEEVDNA